MKQYQYHISIQQINKAIFKKGEGFEESEGLGEATCQAISFRTYFL